MKKTNCQICSLEIEDLKSFMFHSYKAHKMRKQKLDEACIRFIMEKHEILYEDASEGFYDFIRENIDNL